MAWQFASRLALIAFATVSLRGCVVEAEFGATAKTALVGLAAFYGVGLLVGEIARRLVEEAVDRELSVTKRETAEAA